MANIGKPRSIESLEEFTELANNYIEWVKNNPVEKTITASFQGVISYQKVPHSRPMTQHGLASFMSIGLSTLKDYSQKPEYSATFQNIQAVMTSWNIDGATCGDMSGNIVSRIEGLTDNQKLEHSGSINTMSEEDLDKRIAELQDGKK